MKILVTHVSPDLDAFTSCWLITKYLPGWEEAQIKFVAAGSTLNNKPPDDDKNIIHVDTGFGKFDHHQTDAYTSASKLVYDYLFSKGNVPDKYVEPLGRMVDFVNAIDHFAEVNFPEASNDRYYFLLHEIIEGLKHGIDIHTEGIYIVFKLLDSVLYIFHNKVRAEEELKKGYVFHSAWGKSLALEIRNEEAMKLAMKTGYSFVMCKDPKTGGVRIKTLPKKELSLLALSKKITSIDKKGTWFLHASGNMLLNTTSKNPNLIPSPLTLKELIEIVKEM